MTKRLNSKHKVDRRLKVNLWGRPKSPFNTRAYGPGQHGQTKSSKPSDYGIQLQAKQKLKAYYGNINERQFRNIYKKASMLSLCIRNLDEINFFKPKEKRPKMLENLRNIFYKMDLSDKETRILSSVFASLAKKR